MMAEKKRRIELENQGNQLVANLQSQLQGVEKRLPPPGEVPSFYEGCVGTPFLWNYLANKRHWSKKTKRFFQSVPGAQVDIARAIRFLELRHGPDGEPVSKLLGKPTGDGQGFFRFPWSAFQGEASLPSISTSGQGRSDWQRAWHGCKFESLYSIMYHGRLAESRDSEQGDRFKSRAPGVYVHKDGTCRKCSNYMRFVPLCRDGVFWGALWEVFVDRSDHVPVQNTDQWCQPERSVRLAALWLVGYSYDQMLAGLEVSEVWDPIHECDPGKRSQATGT